MQKKIVYLILFFSFSFHLLNAQEIEVDTTFTYFSKVYLADTMNIVSYAVVPLENNGAFVSGIVNAAGMYQTIYIRKINQIGETDWVSFLDDSFTVKAFLHGGSYIPTTDGNFILTYERGDSVNTYNSIDFRVIKHNTDGEILWMNDYGSSTIRDSPISVVESIDSSGYVIAGIQQQGPPLPVSDVDIRVIKLGVDGEEVWSRKHSFLGFGDSEVRSIEATNDGGYILGGGIVNNIGFDGDPGVLKLDGEGYWEWEKKFGTNGYDSFGRVHLLKDDNYLLTTSYNLNIGDTPFFAKLNTEGDTLWTKLHYGADYTTIFGLAENEDIYISVNLAQEYPPSIPMLVGLNSEFDTLWTKLFSWNYNEDMVLLDIEKTNDGGFLVNGKSGFGVVPQFSWVSKIDSLGNTCGDLFNCDSVVVEIDTLTNLVNLKNHHYLRVSPNPIHGVGRVDYDLPKNPPYAWLRIYNMQGLEVRSLRLSTCEQSKELSIPMQMGSGVYPYVVEMGGVQLMEGKLVIF